MTAQPQIVDRLSWYEDAPTDGVILEDFPPDESDYVRVKWPHGGVTIEHLDDLKFHTQVPARGGQSS